jgi:hypothetical protein
LTALAADNFFDAFADLCEALIRDSRRGRMDLFHRIDDAQAIVRAKGGVFKQAELYRRSDRLYVKSGGGFLRIEGSTGNGGWGTSSPSVTVLELPTLADVELGGKWAVPTVKPRA